MGELALRYLSKEAASKTAILDTGLLALRITAITDLSLVSTFKRLGPFSLEDALLLEWVVDQFKNVVTTSYVLAEVSNLGNALSGPVRTAWFTSLAAYSQITEEAHVATHLMGRRAETIRFGVTDSALGHLCSQAVLLTTDRPLSGYLQSQGLQAINFGDLRPVWDSP